MFDVEELLSKRNQRNALEHLLSKKDGCGIDGIRISEFKEYWEVNHLNIEKEIREGTYTPGVVKTYEIVNNRGKQRIVSSLNVTDRMISRMLAQKLKRIYRTGLYAGKFCISYKKSRSFSNGLKWAFVMGF